MKELIFNGHKIPVMESADGPLFHARKVVEALLPRVETQKRMNTYLRTRVQKEDVKLLCQDGAGASVPFVNERGAIGLTTWHRVKSAAPQNITVVAGELHKAIRDFCTVHNHVEPAVDIDELESLLNEGAAMLEEETPAPAVIGSTPAPAPAYSSRLEKICGLLTKLGEKLPEVINQEISAAVAEVEGAVNKRMVIMSDELNKRMDEIVATATTPVQSVAPATMSLRDAMKPKIVPCGDLSDLSEFLYAHGLRHIGKTERGLIGKTLAEICVMFNIAPNYRKIVNNGHVERVRVYPTEVLDKWLEDYSTVAKVGAAA